VRIWCGIDWSERHHDIALVDEDGVLVAKRRIAESAAGFRQLLELLAEHQQRSEAPILVAMETVKGLLPAALRAAGYQLFPINHRHAEPGTPQAPRPTIDIASARHPSPGAGRCT